MYWAHEGQELNEHLINTKLYAAEEGLTIGMGTLVSISPELHDCGKIAPDFQKYIKQDDDIIKKGSVNHSSAGAEILMRRYGHSKNRFFALMIEMIAYAISAHHGIYDSIDESGDDNLDKRLHVIDEDELKPMEEIWFDEMNLSETDLNQQLKIAFNEFRESFLNPLQMYLLKDPTKKTEFHFYISCMERLILSIQIDADWTDTARAMGDSIFDDVKNKKIYGKAWKNYQEYMESLEEKAGENNLTERQRRILDLRKQIKNQCIEFSEASYGIYRLSLPTGSGKTLASLGYALKVASERKAPEVSHIFYISPYISITEQNSEAIKDAIGNEEWVMEHHSNVSNSDERKNQLDTAWKEPIICTTMIQFLYTLFSQKNKCIRRFHQLKNSVIIVDEAQALPVQTVHTFNLMMNFLCYICHATIILCTATQPQLASENIKRKIVYTEPEDMIANLYPIFSRFNRTKISCDIQEKYTFETLRTKITESFETERSILLILNKKQTVGDFYTYIKEELTGVNLFYLTTNLCAEHRSARLKEIKKCLSDKSQKVLIISTNLIEAGVDLSVEHIYRSLAGLDSIAQAAGRCNRNGELEQGKVTVVQLEGDEFSVICTAQKKMMEINEHYRMKGRPESIIFPEWMKRYYEIYYREVSHKMDYDIGEGRTVYKLLSSGFSGKNNHLLRQAFKTAGEKYRPIKEDGKTVIVPYEESMDLLQNLESVQTLSEKRTILRKLQRYTVSVYDQGLRECLQNGVVEECSFLPDVYVAKTYDVERGFINEMVLQCY